MIKYIAIKTGTPIRASRCSIEAIKWSKARALSCDINFGGQGSLRIGVKGIVLFRQTSGVPIAAEEDGRPAGISPDHIVYRVEGSSFLASQQQLVDHSDQECTHYRILVPDSCLDIVAETEPKFFILRTV